LLNRRRHVFLEYNISKDISNLIQQRNNALSYLCNCNKIWNIKTYTKVAYTRVNAGAGINVDRRKAKFIFNKAPNYLQIHNNLNIYQLKIGFSRYIFLPDRILIVGFLQVGALRYSDISIDFQSVNFNETDSPPNDALFLGHTWQYVNNNGTPDKRFTNNRQIPICLYGKINISDKNETFLIELQMSNYQIYKEITDKINKKINYNL
jgi:hypothetical protein